MPPMPYPVARPPSLLAIENLLNDRAGRAAVYAALQAHPNDDHRLAAYVLSHSTDPDGRQRVAEAFEAVGQQVHAAGGFEAKPDVEAGIAHLDDEWFDPDPAKPYWYQWRGHAAPIVREGLIAGLHMAGYESPEKPGAPLHLVWTCGSPTFEVSSSPVRAPDGENVLAVCIVISTPGTTQFLWHIEDPAAVGAEQDKSTYDEPPQPSIDYDQVLVGRLAQRINGAVVQDGELFVTGPPQGGGALIQPPGVAEEVVPLVQPADAVQEMVDRGIDRPLAEAEAGAAE